MLCDECGQNQATLHVATIIDGKKKDEHLCPQCWQKRNAGILGGLSVGDLLSQLMGAPVPAPREQEVRCDRCGMTFSQFKSTGRLGCAHCYAAFGDTMKHMLKSIHGHTHHVGRAPRQVQEQMRARRQIDEMRREMEQAVRAEEFERAAQLRDRIRELSALQAQNPGEEERHG